MRFSTPTSAVRAIASARAVSVIGGAAAFSALNLAVYAQTHSELWLAATMFLTFGVVGLTGPLAGALGDHFDRRKVMIISDLVAGVLFLALVFTDRPVWMIALAFLSAIAEVPLWTASAAAVPNLVPEDRVAWANSLVQLGHNAGIMIGPAIGGLLFDAVGAKAVFAINAFSFMVSAWLVTRTDGRFADDRTEEEVAEHAGLSAGFSFLWNDRVLRFITLAWVIVVVGLAMMLTADVPLAALFDPTGTGFAYGLMIGGWGAGSVLGSLLGRKVTRKIEGNVLVFGTLIFTWMLAAIAFSPVFWPIIGALFISGFVDSIVSVTEHGITQKRTPDAVRSRVFAASEAMISIPFAMGFLIAGPLIQAVGPRAIYAIGGLGGGLAVLFMLPASRILARERAQERRAARDRQAAITVATEGQKELQARRKLVETTDPS